MTELDAHLELVELRACLAQARGLEGVDRDACARLAEKFDAHAFNLVVVGEFKRGKSTVINALLGTDLLPTGVVPLTSVVTRLQYGEIPTAMVIFDTGQECAITLDALPDYVTERGNPKNAKHVREVSVAYPAQWLKSGIRLVDTPGIGSVHQHNTATTYGYLPQADAVIFVASVDQPVSRAELDFLNHIRRYAGKVFCLLNKLDYLTEAELAQSEAFATDALQETLGAAVPVFSVSARLAVQGKMENDVKLLARSRFPEFDAALRRFLIEESGAVWAASVQRSLLRLLAEARLAIKLELRALSAPLELLQANLQAFNVKKRETLQAKSDFDALLEADGRKLVKEKIEPDLEVFKGVLMPRLQAALNSWYGELRTQGSAVLQVGLEERLIAEVRAAFDVWRANEDTAVGDAFERLCERFWQRLQSTVDELLRYSAELFSIPFAAVATESLWQSRTSFRYKFWDEPPALMMLTHGFVRLLPAALGQPVILRQAQRRAAELVDMQSGRLRHDFEERIKKSVQDFRREMLAYIETTSIGIETAIEKGRALRLQGASQSMPRRDELGAALTKIEVLEGRLRSYA